MTLFEGRDKPGGRAYVYQDRGFTFDAGPTVITAPECLEELFQIADRTLADYVELLPITPFTGCFGTTVTASTTWAMPSRCGSKLRRAIRATRTATRRSSSTRSAYSKRVTQSSLRRRFCALYDMVRVAPQLARLRADRSVYDTVKRFVRDPHLREALSFHSLLVGGNPFDTSAIYTLIHYLERRYGVWFPRGGTGALVTR